MRIELEQHPSRSANPPLTVASAGASQLLERLSRHVVPAAFGEATLAAVFKLLSATFLVVYTLRFAAVPDGLFLYAQDDFFYYLKIADQILAGHGMSFDGLHATNGFHPLWLAVVFALRAATPRLSDFQLLFNGFLALLTVATFWAALRALALTAKQPTTFTNIFLATAYVFLVEKYSHAMEIKALGLIYPLYLQARWRRSLCGEVLTSGLLVLTRLDFVLYFVVPGVITLGRERRLGRNVWIALSPAFVLGVYALWSHAEFGMWTPVSSAIKQLKDGWIFNPTAFPIGENNVDRLLVTMPFAIDLVFLAWAVWKRMFDRPFFAPLAFCAIFYGLLATTSNWPLWPWYYYPIILCVLHYRQIGETISEVAGPKSKAVTPALRRCGFALATMSLWIACGLLAARATIFPPRSSILEEAHFLAGFEANHPGIYGIGDRAGMPSLLMPAPIVQLEGLVMDREMLALLGSRTPLCQILADYKVRYYVTRLLPETVDADAGACREVVEPQQAILRHPSTRVPVSRATFCDPPLASFRSDGDAVPIETSVYDTAACRETAEDARRLSLQP